MLFNVVKDALLLVQSNELIFTIIKGKIPMEINVYTDGACSNNGRANAKAGLGIYFGENDPRNSSERIIGKQTNNTAELTAILRAAAILQREIMAG